MALELPDLLRLAMDVRIAGVHTAMPGKVRAYDATTQTADVEPMVHQVTPTASGKRLVETLPIIPSVPLVFPRAGGFFLSFPVQVGDTVLLVFGETTMEGWRGTGELVDDEDDRRHGLSGAVAIPGLFPRSGALPDAHADRMVIGKSEGVQAHFLDDEIRIGSGDASDFAALSSKVDELAQAFYAHVHTGNGTSPPVVTSPLPEEIADWGSSAASKVKIE